MQQAPHPTSQRGQDLSPQRSSSDKSILSPPSSVRVKMHNDGRHVTLRRLNDEEAKAEREARRRGRQRGNRDGSMSRVSNFEGQERWRRTVATEAAQAAEMQQAAHPTAPSFMHDSAIPPPPPIPAATWSITSSPLGTEAYETETDVSAYDSNRRRRRAERAQAKQARMGRVEFS
jgi:hypothetical protein